MEKADQIQTHPPQPLIKVNTDHEGIREESENIDEQQRIQSVSISMPPSPAKEYHSQQTKRVLFHSQPIEKISTLHDAIAQGNSAQLPPRIPIRSHSLRDKTFDTFKTFSGGLERQLSNFRGRAQEPEPGSDPNHHHAERGNVPVDRFFDALEGPELDVLRPSEKIILPSDQQWPFLLRFPITSFGICVGVSSQAVMWKTLASTDSAKYLHISPRGNHIAWFVSIALMIIVSTIYALKIVFYFEAVRREYHHPIRVNFFFAPWITLLFLGQGVPSSVAHNLHHSVWYILMAPILCLELKIYGQWMSGGQRRLSKVANPSNHLAILGNFVGALLGANMGLKEGPIFFFAIGVAHYIVLFVTLYQRLPTNETLPKELHPVFFLFVAAPSVASMAWDKIGGSFDVGSRIAYFIAMFLYFSLAIRVNFFRGFRFSLAWWAYTSPMTGAAIASVRYSSVVSNSFTKTFAGLLCIIATLTVAALVVTTMLHAFVFRNLFPNDIGIAISDRRPKGPKSARRWYNRRSGSSDTSIQHYLKFADDKEDIEASVTVTVTDPVPSPSASASSK